jgi:hypothetical protein
MRKMNLIVPVLLGILLLVNCSKKAEVTHNGELFSDPELKTKVMDIPKGSIIEALDYRHHGWSVRDSIKVKFDGKVGYISPRIAVLDQDPKNSVYKWGYRADYKYFYDPSDKKHFDKGFEYPHLKDLPKEKIPLSEILKDTNFDN